MNNYDAMKFFLSSMSGQERIITIPKLYVEFMGNYPGAVLLNQIIFYSDKSKRTDGFFYKSYPDWHDELHLTEKQVRLAVTKMKELGFLETKLKKANGTPTLHYKLDLEALSDAILTFGKNRNQPKGSIETDQREVSLDSDQREVSLTVDNTINNKQEITGSREDKPANAASLQKKKSQQDVSFAYQQHITHNVGPFTVDTWNNWERESQGNLDLIVYAIERTGERVPNDGVRSKERFVDMLIRTWTKEGISTAEAARAFEEKPKSVGQPKASSFDKLAQFAQKEG